MLAKWGRICCLALLMTALILFSGVSMAGAVEVEEYGAKYMKDDDPSMIDVDIIDFKVRLYDMGFYSAGVSDSTLQSRSLDDLTMAAVKLVCTMNPDLTYYSDGVSNVLYWRVMGMVEGELKTPLDEEYRVLTPGETDDAVARVQNRLNQLGYDEAGYTFTAGVYDDELQGAVDAFVACNKFVYDREAGITVEMQELLFSDDALKYVKEEVVKEEPLSDRVFGYLGATSTIAGVTLPNAALLALGFVLLCVIVVLILKLASPTGAKDGKEKKKRKSDELIFRVEYGSETYVHRTDKKNYVRIGRATGDFPLNMADESVSRKHCEICWENGNLMLRDFSSYGTKINGLMCHHSQQALHPGDVIEVGQHRITVEFQK